MDVVDGNVLQQGLDGYKISNCSLLCVGESGTGVALVMPVLRRHPCTDEAADTTIQPNTTSIDTGEMKQQCKSLVR